MVQGGDLADELSRGGRVPRGSGADDELGVATLLAGQVRGDDERRAGGGGFGDGAGAGLGDDDVGAAQPVRHVGGEAEWVQPARCVLRQAVELAVETVVAAADGDDLDVGELGDEDGCAFCDATAAFGAAGEQDHETVPTQAEAAAEGEALAWSGRAD